MATILFNAFSFLQKKLKDNNQPYANVSMDIPEETTVAGLLTNLGLAEKDVEAAFVNGTVVPFDTVLEDADRVALIPPGTPGPYRVMLAMVQRKNPK
jgi:sulfur carrier protein ThiS